MAARNTAHKPQLNVEVTNIIVPTPRENAVVVVPSIGNPMTSSGQRVAEELNDFVGQSFRLVSAPDLATAKATLLGEFPHLSSVIDATFRDMTSGKVVRLQPLLLIGKPGTGKTRLASRLLEILGVSPRAFPCGGVSDAAIAGTARRWESTGPSLPLARILDTRIANPGIILDELEKAGTSRRNGNVPDALLNLLEPLTAAAWMDPYVEAVVDLSHVCWVATTNSLDGLSRPLLDRFQVVRLPDPRPDHLEALGNSLIRSLADTFRLDPAAAEPLDNTELQILKTYWKGGSVRSLAKLIGGVVTARNVPHGPRH